MIRRIGVVGYGHLGQYLVEEIQRSDDMELAFVWNRTPSILVGKVPECCILKNLEEVDQFSVDLIIEVAHPSITEKYGDLFLRTANYMVGSPTALADRNTEKQLLAATHSHGLYIPRGAMWGSEDIRRMADAGTLQALKITMSKHPASFKLNGKLKERNDQVGDRAEVIYEGPVRDLCPLAPNNVNTMAAAAIAAHNLGFDGVQGCLISDPTLFNWHIVQIDVWGPGDIPRDQAFHCQTVKRNPATLGAVTGAATYATFFSSLKAAHGRGPGVHLC